MSELMASAGGGGAGDHVEGEEEGEEFETSGSTSPHNPTALIKVSKDIRCGLRSLTPPPLNSAWGVKEGEEFEISDSTSPHTSAWGVKEREELETSGSTSPHNSAWGVEGGV